MAASIVEEPAETKSRGALALRRKVYAKGEATRADLELLLAWGRQMSAAPEFSDLVAEVATDVLVHQVDPAGYVSESDAAWLIARLSEGGGLACASEFAMLQRVIGHAVSVPPALTAFAVREVEKAILTGRRDALGGFDHEPGIVTREDVEALRAICFAPTRGSSLHVDKATAEALFDIAHATATAPNDPEFPEFFARAVGNYLMGVAFLGTPDRADALAHEAELDRKTSFGDFVAAMRRAPSAAEIGDSLESTEGAEEDAYLDENLETERRLDAASRIDAEEAKWILAHLGRGGPLTPAERRLIAFLKNEAAATPPELSALFEEAA